MKEDCIFFKNKNACNALNELYCKKEGKCAFYKSCKEYTQQGRKKKEREESNGQDY